MHFVGFPFIIRSMFSGVSHADFHSVITIEINYGTYFLLWGTTRKAAALILDGSLTYFIDLILLTTLCRWGRLSLWQK
jgi:hypothetical protein